MKGACMAGRQRTTFQKRQKEAKRLEKQRIKAEKRSARRLEKAQSKVATSLTDQDRELGMEPDAGDDNPELEG
jgi:hypothetical protein